MLIISALRLALSQNISNPPCSPVIPTLFLLNMYLVSLVTISGRNGALLHWDFRQTHT